MAGEPSHFEIDGVDADFVLRDFSIWVHGWAFPNDREQWLNVTARHMTAGSSVVTTGPMIEATDLQRFLSGLERLHESVSGGTALERALDQSDEPGARIVLKATSYGAIEMTVEITPDPLTEKHTFFSKLDQSYLPEAIKSLRKLLKTFAPDLPRSVT